MAVYVQMENSVTLNELSRLDEKQTLFLITSVNREQREKNMTPPNKFFIPIELCLHKPSLLFYSNYIYNK